MPKAVLIPCDEQNTCIYNAKLDMSTWTFAKTLARKKFTFAISEKNFSRDCSLHTQRLTQRKPLSRTFCSTLIYMGVSKNSGIPKSSILIGFSIINHPFWGTPIFGNTHIFIVNLIDFFLCNVCPIRNRSQQDISSLSSSATWRWVFWELRSHFGFLIYKHLDILYPNV